MSLLFCVGVLASHGWDPMAFVRLGTRYAQGDPTGTIGYDGQFAYQIARTPLGAAPYLDIPAYRYQRVLYPLSAWTVALGQASLVPWILIVLNVCALTVTTCVMARLLSLNGQERWHAVTAGLFAGQLVSLRMDLNEPFAVCLALLAVYAFERRNVTRGAACLALSLLSKETSVLFLLGYAWHFLHTKEWRNLLLTTTIAGVPFAALQLALWGAFGEFGLRSGGMGATPFSLVPFGGIVGFHPTGFDELFVLAVILGPLVVGPCLALTACLVRLWWPVSGRGPAGVKRAGSLSPLVFVVALHVVFMATLPFSTYSDLPGLLRVMTGLVVSTLALGAVSRSRRLLNWASLWLASVVLLSFDLW